MANGTTEEALSVPFPDLSDHFALTFSLVPAGNSSLAVPVMLPALTMVIDSADAGFAM